MNYFNDMMKSMKQCSNRAKKLYNTCINSIELEDYNVGDIKENSWGFNIYFPTNKNTSDIIGVFCGIYPDAIGNRHIDQNSPNIIHVCPIDKIEYPVKTNSRVDCKDDISVIKEIIRIYNIYNK